VKLPQPALLRQGGRIAGLVLMDEKAWSKSLENQELWVLHPHTGRLLPVPGTKGCLNLQRTPLGIEAEVTGDSLNLDFLHEGGEVTGEKDDQALANEGWAPAARGTGAETGPEVLSELARVIHGRNAERPEGSYTTHLFQKGEEKIRKKLGEEAVEVLLARENPEIVYELADLFYHALVLMEVRSIPERDVWAELKRRAQ